MLKYSENSERTVHMAKKTLGKLNMKVCLHEQNYLQNLFLWCQCVHNSNFSSFLGKKSNAIRFVFPPWASKIICPICSWTQWRRVNNPPKWCVRELTFCHWVNKHSYLKIKIKLLIFFNPCMSCTVKNNVSRKNLKQKYSSILNTTFNQNDFFGIICLL